MIEAHIQIVGMVQGVGFRFFVERRALELGILGYVRNAIDGSVEVVAQGEKGVLETLYEYLRQGCEGSRIDQVEIAEQPITRSFNQFSIRG